MSCQTLVSNKKYAGKYVALKSFVENKVIASGKNPSEVIKRANKKGIKDPVLIFVPQNRNSTFIFKQTCYIMN
jgi:hypothetical protein